MKKRDDATVADIVCVKVDAFDELARIFWEHAHDARIRLDV